MNSGKADTPAGDASIHLVTTIDWTRGKWSGSRGKYSREHQWRLDPAAGESANVPTRPGKARRLDSISRR